MAPADVLDEVRDLVKKLESRLGRVEARLDGRNPDQQSQLSQMRMILMGPPGAGNNRSMLLHKPELSSWNVEITHFRQRNSSAENQRQVLHLPSGIALQLSYSD